MKGVSDLRTRNGAIPVLMQVFGYNRNEQSDNDISQATNKGDLSALITPTGTDIYVRILRPLRAQVVAAYLSLTMQTAAGEPNPSFTVSISKTTSDTDLTMITETAAQIAADQVALKGTNVPFQNTAGQAIVVDRLDLTDLLPAYGSADYRADCFVLGIHFKSVPVAGYHLYRFQVDGSALIVR